MRISPFGGQPCPDIRSLYILLTDDWMMTEGGLLMGRGTLNPKRGNLDKWEMYKALRDKNIGPCKLPRTYLLSERSMAKILSRYSFIFLKPVDTWGGRGISVVQVTKGTLVWRKLNEPDREYNNEKVLYSDLHAYYRNSRCIAQQAAPLMKIDGRPFDIRVHMQRDLDDEWVHAGSLVRVAGPRSFVSNTQISHGSVIPVAEALSSAEKQIEQKLSKIGHSISTILAEYRHFQEIGIDLGIDGKGKLWLIEVNTDDALGGPSHDLFAKLPNKTLYQNMIRRTEERRLQVMRAPHQ